jgi:hypothetical protein
MSDERNTIISMIAEYKAIQANLKACHTQFLKVGCRYRTDILCGHSRFTVQKWPGYKPQSVTCSPKVCPRN